MATVSLSQGGTTLAQTTVTVTSTPLFDGRAVTQGSLPTTTGLYPNVVQTPANPFGVWTGSNPNNGGYTYMNDDGKVIADPTGRWGKVFQWAPVAGDHSPYNLNPTPGSTFAEITKGRPTGIGTVLWFAESFLIPSPFTFPDWGSFASYGYQTVLYDQLALGCAASPASGGPKNAWTLTQTAGLVQNGRGAVQEITGLTPVVLDQWADFITGVLVADDNTGWVEVHYRPQGGSWSKIYTQTGIPTVEWTNTTGTPNVGSTVLDKTGLYFGRWSGVNPGPTGIVLSRGTMRHSSLADAVASLG